MPEPAATLFPVDDESLYIDAYRRTGRTLDDLPYTDDFESLYRDLVGDTGPSRQDVFRRLMNMRKAGKLPRLGRAASSPPKITAEQETQLAGLVVEACGKLSLRDQLLYDDAFEPLATRFNAEAGLSLSHHDLWRIIAKLAK